MTKIVVSVSAIIFLILVFTTGIWIFFPKKNNGSFSAAEVAKHNDKLNCWVTINNNVYGLTAYVSFSSQPDKILNNCGKSVNNLFSDKEMDLLSGMKVGILKQ